MLQEVADAVGLSVLSGANEPLFAQLGDAMRERGLADVLVFGGGIVPDDDLPRLAELGVARVFTPGAAMASITEWLTEALDARQTSPDRS